MVGRLGAKLERLSFCMFLFFFSPSDFFAWFTYFYWHILNIQYCISFRHTAEWFDICIHYKMITVISLVTICPCTDLLQYYWPYSLCCMYPRGLLYNWRFVPFNPLHLFLYCLQPLPSGNCSFVLYESIFICLGFLDSTYKWDYVIFVFRSSLFHFA